MLIQLTYSHLVSVHTCTKIGAVSFVFGMVVGCAGELPSCSRELRTITSKASAFNLERNFVGKCALVTSVVNNEINN